MARRGRLFAQLDDHHHGGDRLAVWLPAQVGVQEMLVRSDPKRFFVPPYVGPRGWVGVRFDRRPDWRRVAALVRDAHAQVADRTGLAKPAPARPRRAAHRKRSLSP